MTSELSWDNQIPALGQLAYTGIAISGVTMAALRLFRYQAVDNFFDNGDLVSFNWYKLSN